MDSRRNTGRTVQEETSGGNRAPPQVPAAEVQVPFNQVVLTDGEVRETLVHISQSITTQA